MPPDSHRPRPAWLRASTALAAVVLGVLLVIGFEVVRPCIAPSATFDAASWRNGRDALICSERDDMIDDLRENHLGRGMTRSEVMALLGQGEEAATAAAELNDLAYKVSCGIDCSWLVVSFDRAEKVTTAEVWND